MTATAGDSPVPLSLIAVAAAARIAAAQGDGALCDSISRVIRSAADQRADTDPGVAAFLRAARAPDSDAILPFDGDPFTIDMTAISIPQVAGEPGIRLFSRLSRAELGYFRCERANSDYVDRTSQWRHASYLLDMPDLGVPADWLDAYAALAAAPASLTFPPDAADRLQTSLPETESTRWRKGTTRVKLSLLRRSRDGEVSQRGLGGVTLEKPTEESLAANLTFMLSSEQQIELHAATFDGSWIHIGDDTRGILAPTPSLEPDVQAGPCRVMLPHIGMSDIPGLRVQVPIPLDLATTLVQRFFWVAPASPSAWLSMLTAPSPAHTMNSRDKTLIQTRRRQAR
jgi:hypothetical protein